MTTPRNRPSHGDAGSRSPRREKLEVVLLDTDFIVVNKPVGMWPKHGVLGEAGVFDELAGIDGIAEESLANVFPIEPDISGLMLLSRNEETLQDFRNQVADRRLTLTCLAIVRATLLHESGEIDCPLVDATHGGGHVRVDRNKGQPALTEWRTRDSYVGFALLECVPRSFVPHQVRAHLTEMGLPLAVDKLFAGSAELMLSSFKAGYRKSNRHPERPLIMRPTLHSSELVLRHPRSGDEMKFEASPPKDFRATLHQLDRFGRIAR